MPKFRCTALNLIKLFIIKIWLLLVNKWMWNLTRAKEEKKKCVFTFHIIPTQSNAFNLRVIQKHDYSQMQGHVLIKASNVAWLFVLSKISWYPLYSTDGCRFYFSCRKSLPVFWVTVAHKGNGKLYLPVRKYLFHNRNLFRRAQILIYESGNLFHRGEIYFRCRNIFPVRIESESVLAHRRVWQIKIVRIPDLWVYGWLEQTNTLA